MTLRSSPDERPHTLVQPQPRNRTVPQQRHAQSRGKLLPKERVERLLDAGSPFLEIGQLAANGMFEGKTTRFDAAGAVMLSSKNSVKVELKAIQALGGAGYTKDWSVERLMRDSKLMDIGAGTNEIRQILIGRELIGMC